MENVTLYCDLITMEQVLEFEQLMVQFGYDRMCRPMAFARRQPGWVVEQRERMPGEDPLAAITLYIDHDNKQLCFDAGYRCCSGRFIEPEMMKLFLLIHHYSNLNILITQPSAHHGQEHQL